MCVDRIGGSPHSARTPRPQLLPCTPFHDRDARASGPVLTAGPPRIEPSPEDRESLAWKRLSTCSRWPSCRGSPRAARASCSSRGPLARDARAARRTTPISWGRARSRRCAAGAAQRAAEAETIAARRLGIEIVGCDEDRYPQWLRRTYTPPLVLWVKGTLVPDEGTSVRSPSSARARRARSGSPSPAAWPTSSRPRASWSSPAWRAESTRPRTAAPSTPAAARWPSWAPASIGSTRPRTRPWRRRSRRAAPS